MKPVLGLPISSLKSGGGLVYGAAKARFDLASVMEAGAAAFLEQALKLFGMVQSSDKLIVPSVQRCRYTTSQII